MKINPKLSDFTKDATLLGLWWAIAWRGYLIYLAFCFLVGVGIGLGMEEW